MGEISLSVGEQPTYYSYLLRLWQEDEQCLTWRMSLEKVHTGERRGFASLGDLFDFLQQQTKISSQSDLGLGQTKEVVTEQLKTE